MMKALSVDLFGFEANSVNVEQNVIANEDEMGLVFNYIDFSFQLFDRTLDKTYSKISDGINCSQIL